MPLVPPPAAEEREQPARAALWDWVRRPPAGGSGVESRRRLGASGGGRRVWHVRRVDRAPAAIAPARAHRATNISVKRGHGHAGVQGAQQRAQHADAEAVRLCARADAPRGASLPGVMASKSAAIGTESSD